MVAERERQTDLGIENNYKTNQEVWQIIKNDEEKKAKAMSDAREQIVNSIDSSIKPVTAAPMLKDQDIDFLAQT